MVSQFSVEEATISKIKLLNGFFATDDRGGLTKAFSKELYLANGIKFEVVETLIIKSKKNVLRGIHFQKEKEVGKLLTCVYGTIFVVVVDIQKESKDFGKWISTTITENQQVYVPKGYALGTYALEDSCLVCLNDEKMYPELDSGIVWNDKELSIDWPLITVEKAPIISDRDRRLSSFGEYCSEG